VVESEIGTKKVRYKLFYEKVEHIL